MVFEDRQRVIETNRSLRLIKNELEALLEKGVITDAAFDSIHSLLPAESALSGPRTATNPNLTPQATPSPAPTPSHTANNNPTPAPPSYAQSTASPPSLPSRNPQPPAGPPEKPVLTMARALYHYAPSDTRDLALERDDRVAVHEYMNADWWMGRNLRTGAEGIFPRNYVMPEESSEKQQQQPAPVVGYQQPQYAQPVGGGYPGQGQSSTAAPFPPYQDQQPQQQPQQQEGGGSKMGEHGKKFGKKLGNAAIFGAGATIGSNIVNSIF
ncbi:SH3 domain-containing protein [Staphylotrichum tortipilum]|uniref:SH3 domain-containing protein n=1 Tax=Staphylotrichum tortipilum TaxID=2831512 RepID=A0AAN6RSD9_9PEZI|nr:SH3 domain-containing protein [Staphylotrichum longicolle]